MTSDTPSLYFKLTPIILKCTGLWVSPSDRTVNKKIVIIYVTIFFINFAAVAHKFYTTASDLFIGIETLLHSAFLFHTILTYLLLVRNQKIIMRMYNMAQTNFNHFYKLFKKDNKYQLAEEKATMIVTIYVGTVILTVHVSFVYVTRFYMIHLDYTEKQFIYPVSMPFELNNITYYIVLAIQFLSIVCEFFVHVASVSLCIGFTNLLCAQLYLLGDTITEITSKDKLGTSYNNKEELMMITEDDIQINKDVKMWTVHHNLLFRFHSDIQNTFGISILQLLVNCELILCLSCFQTYQMYQDHHYEQFFKNFCMLVALTVHSFLYFWYGEKLQEKSINFRDHICRGKWYERPQTFKTSFKIILERTKSPIVFKAANLVPVTIVSFITFLQAAFSYFNLLLALKDTP